MQHQDRSKHGQNNRHKTNHDEETKVPPMTGIMIGVWSFVICVFILWVFIPNYIGDRSEATKAFLESLFSLALLIIVIGHTYIYASQAKALAEQTRLLKQSVEITEQTAIYANRAYVVAKIRDLGPLIDQFMFRLRIENNGNTPTLMVMS